MNTNDKPIDKFKYNVDNINDKVLTPFYLMIKNNLRNDSISFNERLEMFLYCEYLLPINTEFMWLDHEMDFDLYKNVLKFYGIVLFKDLISLLNSLPAEYIHNLNINKNVIIEKAIRSGYRGFSLY